MKLSISIYRQGNYLGAYIYTIYTFFELPKVKLYGQEQSYTGLRTIDYFIELLLQQFELYHFYQSTGMKMFYWYILKFYEPKEQDRLYLKFEIGDAKIKITKEIFYGEYTYATMTLHTFPFRSLEYSQIIVWPRSINFNSRKYKRAFISDWKKTISDWSKNKADSKFRHFKIDFLKQLQPKSLKEKMYFKILKHNIISQ